ncbi:MULTISPECIES: tyrosine-protein phosphatase [unclassified Microbacterium]|uniref:tyrosine-protein phosphatase n=1 Tax=unclassified Microbacterium TaxID=2609290 RepID=UPI000EAA14D4|nr:MULTISPECIES: tyrosine-protein phosphatase [unclassified Microbacterium]MBT2484222.1 tyrosine-protein phosphatase [Microbacterium sp. ISL-108]RKN67152.1 tyrosine-protein phosphatase [Microbacterium sp. CGR2]
MTTIDTDLVLSAPVNLRDLGGIAIEGGVLREGLAIRTDDLAYVTENVAAELVAGGITAIIDLRSPVEVSVTGRGPLAEHPISYHHLPLIADVGESMDRDAPTFSHESMGLMYLRMVENAAPQLVIALNVIAYTPGAAAFHCAAGRDRTGVLAAMLLLALGAADDDIVTDYALTGNNMRAIMQRTAPVMGAMWRALGFDASALSNTSRLLEGSMDVSMRSLLDTLRAQYGDPLTPLRAAGLSEATIARLRERALAA